MIAFAALAIRRGFIAVILSLAGLILTFFLAFSFYPSLAATLSDRFGWSPVWTQPVAFVLLWVVCETVFTLLGNVLITRFSARVHYSTTNRALAVLPGALQGLIFAAVILTVLALVPLPGYRQQVIDGTVSGRLVQSTLAIERPLENIFGPAARQTLGFITVRLAHHRRGVLKREHPAQLHS